jgi:hypothetical protein
MTFAAKHKKVVANDMQSATTWWRWGESKPPCAAAPGRGSEFHLAVPEKPFGLTLFLRFFDRCG